MPCGERGLLSTTEDVIKAQKTIYCSDFPMCVAIHDNKEVYVSSYYHIDLMKDYGGFYHPMKIAGNEGHSGGQFDGIYGMSIKEDVLYVADHINCRIQKLTTSGKLLHQFGQRGSGQGELDGPAAVIAGPENRLIVSNFNNHRVQIFNEDGGWLSTIDGNGGSGDSGFRKPWGLALDSQGNLHVAAYGSGCIKVFTLNGAYVREYGNLKKPLGLAINTEGYTVVSEGDGNCLTIFDPQGNKIRKVEGLTDPWGVALGPRDGSVYVCNRMRQTVEIFVNVF